MAIVTLLSDFGTVDGYVGAMKGVILSRAPSATLVDLTHDIAPQNVRAGAWALKQTVPHFPPGTIHVGVVDPGVGSARNPLLLRRGDGQLLVGPDNGLFSHVAGPGAQAFVLDRRELFLPEVSRTFHGRDIFAAVAGHLAAGRPPEQCGTQTDSWVTLPAADVIVAPAGEPRRGRVVHVDRFGNLVTNLPVSLLAGRSWRVELAGRPIGAVQATFASVDPGAWVAYPGSSGLLELAVRDGDAAAELGDSDPLQLEVMLCPA